MKQLLSLLLAITLLFTVTACAPAAPAKEERTVTDRLSRTVALPAQIERVVCIGAGALRLYSYVGDLSLLCGVESCEYGYLISVRPYQMVNAALFQSLPSVGAGGPQGAPDAEALLAVHPDVIFSLYTSDAGAMDELQRATGVPVVTLSYGQTEAFDPELLASLTLMGEVLGREARAAEVTGYLEALQADLDSRTADLPDESKPTVYLGCQSNYGTHGIGSSTANYSLFNVLHAKNVLDLNGYTGYQSSIDLETLVTLNPQVILLDAGGLSLLREEYQKRREVFDSLSAFRSGEVYVQMPYNAYYTNLEIAYADAYFAGTVLCPDRFADVNIEAKFREISTKLLGSDCYPAVADTLGGYRRLDIAATLG